MANWKRTLEVLAVFSVLLLAAYLRMGHPGIIEYKRDEANLAQLAINFAGGEGLPLLGIGSSVGIPNAPVNVYLLTPPYLFSSDPQLATQYIGLLNVIAILIVYLIARQYIQPLPALLLILALSSNPWAIIFSRKIWAQNMLMPFIVATVGTGILGFVEKKKWAQIAHFPLLAITGQIHYGAFVLIPVSIYLLWVGRKSISRVMIVGLVLMGLVSLPYLIGMLNAGFDNLSTIRNALHEGPAKDSALQISDQAARSTDILISGKELHALAGPEQFENYLDTIPNVYPLFELMSIGVALAIIWLIIRSVRFRDARTPVDITLLIWFFSPIIIYSLTWTPFFIHYLIPIFPAAFLIMGFGLHDLFYGVQWNKSLIRTLSLVIIGLFGLIFFFQISLWLSLLTFVDTHYTPDGFGTPLHYLTAVRDRILNERPSQVIGDLGEQWLIYDNEPTVWNTLLADIESVRFIDAQTHVYPNEPAIYLTNECTDQIEQFPLRNGEGCYAIEQYMPDDFPTDRFELLTPGNIRFANGVSLSGYNWDAQCLELLWQIAAPTDQNYSFAINFYDVSGERIGQADALSWPGIYWRPGDQVIRTFCVSEPLDNAASVRIGMYIYDGQNFFNVDLLDEANNPAGQMVPIDLN